MIGEKITRKDFLNSFPIYHRFNENIIKRCEENNVSKRYVQYLGLKQVRKFLQIGFIDFSIADKKEFFRILQLSKKYPDEDLMS